MHLMQLPLEVIAALVDQMVVVTTNTKLIDGLQLRLVNHLFDQEVARAFYKTELVDFHSDANRTRASRMPAANQVSLWLGCIAGPNKRKNGVVQELQDGVEVLVNMDETAFVQIDSVCFDQPWNLYASWTRTTQRVDVDRQLILQTVIATVQSLFGGSIPMRFLGPDDPRTTYKWSRGDEDIHGPYRGADWAMRGIDWALLTAAFLGNVRIIAALLERNNGLDWPEGLLNRALELAAAQGHFEAVLKFLESNVDPNKRGTCKGSRSCGKALAHACIPGHTKIVDLLLQPIYNIPRKGPDYEYAVWMAARGRPCEPHGHIELMRSMLAKGEVTGTRLVTLRREILGEACMFGRGREDIVRLILQDIKSVNFWWRGTDMLAVARRRWDEGIMQALVEHGFVTQDQWPQLAKGKPTARLVSPAEQAVTLKLLRELDGKVDSKKLDD